MLTAADRARLAGDLLFQVFVEFLERDDAVAIQVGGALEPLHEVVREDPVSKVGQLDGHLRGPGRGDDGAPLGSREALEEEVVDRARAGLLRRERPPTGRPAVAGVEKRDDAVGLDAAEDGLKLVHRERRRVEVVGIRVARDQVLGEAVALDAARIRLRRPVPREVDEHRVVLLRHARQERAQRPLDVLQRRFPLAAIGQEEHVVLLEAGRPDQGPIDRLGVRNRVAEAWNPGALVGTDADDHRPLIVPGLRWPGHRARHRGRALDRADQLGAVAGSIHGRDLDHVLARVQRGRRADRVAARAHRGVG